MGIVRPLRRAGVGQWVEGVQELLGIGELWDGVQLADERCRLKGSSAWGSRDKIRGQFNK
jgi:hypothetical protein